MSAFIGKAECARNLHVQRRKGVATGRQCDANTVVERVRLVVGARVLRLIQFEVDLGQVVELRDRIAFDFCLYTAFQDAVEQCVDMRLFGEVEEAFGRA